MKYESIQELVYEACKNNEKISTVVLKDQAKSMDVSELELLEKAQFSVLVCFPVRESCGLFPTRCGMINIKIRKAGIHLWK